MISAYLDRFEGKYAVLLLGDADAPRHQRPRSHVGAALVFHTQL